MKFRRNFVIYFIILVIMSACGTHKNTGISRSYHNLVSKYNIYFNAKEAYKSGVATTVKAYKEPFQDILPIFFYKQKSILTGAAGDMDIVIAKAKKLITKHSITARPKQRKKPSTPREREFFNKKEYNNWIDDSYLVMGKAFFYQDKIFEAQKCFWFIITEYRNQPIRFESSLWYVRTKIANEQYDEAKNILDKLSEDAEMPEILKSDLYALYADVHIQKQSYANAIASLEKAISHTKSKKTIIRYSYIIAQLSQLLKENAKANEYFTLVEKMNPPYDFSFNAKINRAISFELGSEGSKDVISNLNKLLRDEKNKEFVDQIYFAMANVYSAEGNKDLAIEYYKKSIATTTNNQHQKAMSYLEIGKIYYDGKKYIASQPFYDSCVSILPKDYRQYQSINETSTLLNMLSESYEMSRYNDSLLRVASMTEKERNSYIDKIIKKIVDAENEILQKEELARQEEIMYGKTPKIQAEVTENVSWYFYNPTIVTSGKTEFKKSWGERILEDHWRRSTKTTNFADASFDESEKNLEEGENVKTFTDVKSREYYLQDLPLTDSLKKASLKLVEEGMFNQAMVYLNLMKEDKLAISQLESYIARFSNHTYTPIAMYYLYNLYSSNKNVTKAESYKNQILSQYPQSNYAKALKNPEFYKEYASVDNQIEKNYVDCYRTFARAEYAKVVEQASQQIQQFPNSYLRPRFEFLMALANARIIGVASLQPSLTKLVAAYPQDESVVLAKQILEYLSKNDAEKVYQLMTAVVAKEEFVTEDSKALQEEAKEEATYSLDTKAPLYYMVIVKTEFVDVKKMRFNIINYNLDYFTNFNFVVDIRPIDSKNTGVIVSSFQNLTQSMNYYDLVNYNQQIYEGIDKVFTSHCVISESNLQLMLIKRNADSYLKFFDEHYSR